MTCLPSNEQAARIWDKIACTKHMESDARLNWHFESSSRYSGLSHCVLSLSHQLRRSSRPELGLIASSPTSSSPQLPRLSRRDQTCRHRVRLLDT